MFDNRDFGEESDSKEFELNLEDDVYDGTKPTVYRTSRGNGMPNRASAPVVSNKQNGAVTKLVKFVVAVFVLILVGDFVMGLMPKKISLDHVVNMTTEEAELALGLTFARDSSMADKVNHYSKGKLTVDGNGEIGIVYIDGKHVGLHVDSSNYTLFGVKIGDSSSMAEQNMTFKYDNHMTVVNDRMEGVSTALFYYNEANNDCLVVIYNDVTNRAVALTYFNDYKKVTETLSFF